MNPNQKEPKDKSTEQELNAGNIGRDTM